MSDEAGPPVIGVAALSTALKRLIEEAPGMKSLAVRGEISNVHLQRGSGHCYFSLKEQQAVLNCIVLARYVPFLPPLRDGAKIVASGALTTYAAQGRYQLRATTIRLDGEGDLFAAFESLRIQLAAEGLFEPERKRVLPRCPFAVALVSSATADGARDFRTVLAKRAPHIRVSLFETSVQGEHAPAQIVAALQAAAASMPDLIVLVRGGGSFEDLFAFSHESVVRAIAACPLPVITGIGHESDVTLADHVADVRASTPTDAATRLPDLQDLLQSLRSQRLALLRGMRTRFAASRERLHQAQRRLEAKSPRSRLQERARTLLALRLRLVAAMRQRERERELLLDRLREHQERAIAMCVQRNRHRLQVAVTALHGRDPHALLALGYAIIRVDGSVVKDAAHVPLGTLVVARLARGTLQARVEAAGDYE